MYTTESRSAVTPRRRTLTRLSAAVIAVALVLAACSDSDDEPNADPSSTTEAGAGATFTFKPLDVGGPLTKDALENGDIDIGVLFSSDGAIPANEWVALEDDEKLQPVDNFIPAIREDANTPEIAAVLNAVMAKLTREAMQDMVNRVAIDGEDPQDVADAFLEDNDLPGDLEATGSLTVGSSNFAESNITAGLFAGALEQAGVEVDKKLDIGAREVYLPALERGDIDLVPEFVGTLLTFLEGEPSTDLEETTAAARTAAEEKGYTVLEASPADSVNTFVVTKDTADKYSLAKVSDLAGVEDELTLGGPPECPERQPCLLGLKEVYGLKFAE
ncbi:MAG: glycine betaine ABC transporter substrate-binding protein [Acidimicrobiales bacterium]